MTDELQERVTEGLAKLLYGAIDKEVYREVDVTPLGRPFPKLADRWHVRVNDLPDIAADLAPAVLRAIEAERTARDQQWCRALAREDVEEAHTIILKHFNETDRDDTGAAAIDALEDKT